MNVQSLSTAHSNRLLVMASKIQINFLEVGILTCNDGNAGHLPPLELRVVIQFSLSDFRDVRRRKKVYLPTRHGNRQCNSCRPRFFLEIYLVILRNILYSLLHLMCNQLNCDHPKVKSINFCQFSLFSRNCSIASSLCSHYSEVSVEMAIKPKF